MNETRVYGAADLEMDMEMRIWIETKLALDAAQQGRWRNEVSPWVLLVVSAYGPAEAQRELRMVAGRVMTPGIGASFWVCMKKSPAPSAGMEMRTSLGVKKTLTVALHGV